MTQSTLHVAVIMDGNGRWAEERGLPRAAGHRAGALAVERTVEAAPPLGITDLTLYAFSSDNWKRPRTETELLMRLFQDYLLRETERCRTNGIALRVIGRRDRLAPAVVEAIGLAERDTRDGARMTLRIAIDYSSRWLLAHRRPPIPDVDLLIRTGREKRLSDFLLWESSYAELCFLDTMWPDFTGDDLAVAVEDFHVRTRRFGAIEVANGTR